LYSIVIPISKPIIATVVLWRAVWHWNSWFDVMLYIKDYDKMALQYVLRRIVIEGASDAMNVMLESATEIIPPENIKAATIIFSTIPILIVYPFLQRYFVKGVMVGSVKG
jgi:putative aldouronate transport system permease protein